MNPHPAADLFPVLDEDALWSLVNDIKLHGLIHPIVTWNSQIIDGRNRFKACDLAGVKPRFKEMSFDSERDAVSYIVSTNIHRRHLTDEQRDVIGAKLVTMQAHRPSEEHPQNAGVTVSAAAEMVSSTPARIERARTIVRADPELADKVVKGEISKGKALRQIRERTAPKPQTDPDQAADAVVDEIEKRHAAGDTPKMRKVWAAYSALDATEQTAFRSLMESLP